MNNIIKFLSFSFPISLALSWNAFAAPSFDDNISLAPCEDYATKVLLNPWDMSEPSDVNNFTNDDILSLSALSFSSGIFNFTNAQAAGGTFHLISPQINSVQPIGGRWGVNYPIDTSKYTQLSVRMNLDQAQNAYGMRLRWNRGEGSSEDTYSQYIPTRTGWATYKIDLNSLTSFQSNSKNPHAWNYDDITGLAILPLVPTGAGQVDFIRLEDPTSCGSATVDHAIASSGDNDLLSIYVDDDSDPINGYHTKLESAITAPVSTGSFNVSSNGLYPSNYKLIARLDSDFATLERDDPWDMVSSSDISNSGGIDGLNFSSGILSGTGNSGGTPQVYLTIPSASPITASKYSKLTIKISRPSNDSEDMLLFWGNTGSGSGSSYITSTANDPDGNQIYELDLSGNANWTGNIDELILNIFNGTGSGKSFSIDYIQLRKTGYAASESVGVTTVGSGILDVNDSPIVKLLQPDIKGGEVFRQTEMNAGDFIFSDNVDNATDSAHAGENLTCYLPDVREIGGLRGEFFKGTNQSGSGDTNDFLTFPGGTSRSYTIDADTYRHLCVKMMIDRDYDVTLGSVTKYIYQKVGGSAEEADAWVTLYDRWGSDRWYEYCLDAADHPRENGLKTWGGQLEFFRFDSNEFSFDSCCDGNGLPIGNPIQVTYYYDHLRLAKHDTSYGKYLLPYELTDTDSTPTITFSYATTKDSLSPTIITAGNLNCEPEGHACIWDTTSVSNGDYYIYLKADDGNSSTQSVSSSVVRVRNGDSSVENAPILSLDNPVTGREVCSSMQVKGYAIDSARLEPISLVQFFIDGVYKGQVVPDLFHPAAKASYPNALSGNGFNEFVDVSGLTDGSHTLTVKAYSSDGGITGRAVSFIKNIPASGCSSENLYEDPAPSGTPVAADVLEDVAPAPSAPTIKTASFSKKGLFTMIVNGLSSSMKGCTLKVYAGKSSKTLVPVNNFAVQDSEISAGSLKLTANKILINKTKLPKVFVGAQYSCESGDTAVVAKNTKIVKVATAKIAKIGAVVKQLKAKLVR